MSLVLGLTGSIASGKTTVSKMFEEERIPVIDTDRIARKALDRGEKPYKKVVKEFGEKVLNVDRTINREALGKIIFNNKRKRELLNSIVHPYVKDECFRLLALYKKEEHPIIVMDVPLLFETKFHVFVDKTVLVTVDYEEQIRRLMQRDHISREYAKIKIDAQMSLKEKEQLADYVIDNSRSVLHTKRSFYDLLEELEV